MAAAGGPQTINSGYAAVFRGSRPAEWCRDLHKRFGTLVIEGVASMRGKRIARARLFFRTDRNMTLSPPL